MHQEPKIKISQAPISNMGSNHGEIVSILLLYENNLFD